MIRSLYAATEPTHCLRPGERIIGAAYSDVLMPEYIIEREDRTRRAMRAQAAFLARLFPPMGIVPKRARRFSRFDAHGRPRKKGRR
jgi:hypothetical protein